MLSKFIRNRSFFKRKRKSSKASLISWSKFKKDKAALTGLILIGLFSLVAILGSVIRPDKTKNVTQQVEEIQFQPPGFSVIILKEKTDFETDKPGFLGRLFFGGTDLEYKHIPIYDDYKFDGELIKYTIWDKDGNRSDVAVKNVAAILYPLSHDNQYLKDGDNLTFKVLGKGKVTRSISSMQKEIKESNLVEKTYWLGTDSAGKDMLSLIMASFIVSISVGFIAVSISVFIGITLGAIAGYYRGWVDDVIMWFINVVWSLPTLLFVIAITFALGKGMNTIFIAVGLTMWVEIARVVRGQVLSFREKEFVEAGKALGYSNFRIIFLHILPNVLGPVIVVAAAIFASAILIEAGLSYLGLGTQEPQPSLGVLVAHYSTYINQDGRAYLALIPGFCIMILVLCFMLIGNGIRDAMDNRSVDDIKTTGT